MNLVQLVRDGDAYYEFAPLRITIGDETLIVQVFRQPLQVDGAPPMTWNRKAIAGMTRTFNGLRPPATPNELQEIADLLNCMLLTPKVLDLMWDEAGKTGVRFDSITQVGGKIVAECNIHNVHEALDAAIARAGGDNGGIIMSLGKYWVICNRLLNGKFSRVRVGDSYINRQAINYSWYSSSAPPHRKSVTGNARVWQQEGGAHPDNHIDPSQLVLLMHRWAVLLHDGTAEEVDLYELAQNPKRCHFISHEGPLKIWRMPNVEIQAGLNMAPLS